jgi:hypothetical protein
MAIVTRVTGQNFTTEKYDEIVKRLEAAGEGSPVGRMYHVCFGDKENLRVSDIWDTRENCERFMAVVGRLSQEIGLQANEPEFFEVHNIIVGEQTRSAGVATGLIVSVSPVAKIPLRPRSRRRRRRVGGRSLIANDGRHIREGSRRYAPASPRRSI